MSEEVKDAGLVVPRAMMTSFFVNGFMGLILLISYLFCISNVEDALNDETGYPFLHIMRSFLSDEAVTGITCVILLIILICGINVEASASRQLYALARDKGTPFSKWISHVSFTCNG